MTRVIDYDRGVVIKVITDLGLEVFMYKDSPGEYLSVKGKRIPVALAAKAGFDVETLEKKREKKAAQRAFADAYDKKQAGSTPTKNVVWEKNGFKVIAIGTAGGHIVEDPDGDNLVPGKMLSKEAAIELVGEFFRDNPVAAEAEIAKMVGASRDGIVVGPGRGVGGSGSAEDLAGRKSVK